MTDVEHLFDPADSSAWPVPVNPHPINNTDGSQAWPVDEMVVPTPIPEQDLRPVEGDDPGTMADYEADGILAISLPYETFPLEES